MENLKLKTKHIDLDTLLSKIDNIQTTPTLGTLSANEIGAEKLGSSNLFNANALRTNVEQSVPPNGLPEAVDDQITIVQDSTVTYNVIQNDIDPDGDPLEVQTITNPKNGRATFKGVTITYKPNKGFVGTDSFTYVVIDGKGGRAFGRVTITITNKKVLNAENLISNSQHNGLIEGGF